mmetsp:Transcript_15757/g.43600  ORF Transcript_15757/g.43600 Transcript_15757/m.43600 type:complete len:250 (+) Transcript_15757:44-793(+)
MDSSSLVSLPAPKKPFESVAIATAALRGRFLFVLVMISTSLESESSESSINSMTSSSFLFTGFFTVTFASFVAFLLVDVVFRFAVAFFVVAFFAVVFWAVGFFVAAFFVAAFFADAFFFELGIKAFDTRFRFDALASTQPSSSFAGVLAVDFRFLLTDFGSGILMFAVFEGINFLPLSVQRRYTTVEYAVNRNKGSINLYINSAITIPSQSSFVRSLPGGLFFTHSNAVDGTFRHSVMSMFIVIFLLRK